MDLWSGLTKEEITILLKELDADILEFKKENNILSTLHLNTYIAYIIEGTIQIIKEDYYGNRTIEEEVEKGKTFGSILSTLDKEHQLIANETTKILLIEYNRIFSLETEHAKIYNQFLKNLLHISNEKIKEKNERLQIVTQKTIRNKLLTYFDIISSKTMSKNIYLPFTFTELAGYLSIDRSAMSRELNNLKKEGFIAIKGRRITIVGRTGFDKDYENIHF
jgi:CRP-like cAMP-binding protein